MRQPTPMDDFLFDLNGYLVLKGALEPDLVAALNAEFDQFPLDLPLGHWYKGSQRRDYNPATGLELHNCVEIGEPFQRLVDHPSWIELVRHYGGEENSYVSGLFIDECIASVRTAGGRHNVHSGGYRGAIRGAYNYKHGVFRCGQINILPTLTDIGPGDGPTMVIPGSHKSNFPHPQADQYSYYEGKPMDDITGAIPVYLEKGDALLFVDGLMHGGAARTNSGDRRILIYRYGPVWAASRFGYSYSRQLLDSITPAQRKILEPVPPVIAGETRIPREN